MMVCEDTPEKADDASPGPVMLHAVIFCPAADHVMVLCSPFRTEVGDAVSERFTAITETVVLEVPWLPNAPVQVME